VPAGKSQAIIFRQGLRTLTEADKARRREEVTAWARVQNAAGHKLGHDFRAFYECGIGRRP
jgi:hypothetical protein